MNDRPHDDEPLIPEIQDLADRAVASVPRRLPPHDLRTTADRHHRPRRDRRRVVYPAAVATAAVAIVLAFVATNGNGPAPSDPLQVRAAAPTSSVVPGPLPSPGATDDSPDPIADQLAADAAIAGAQGLTLGLEVTTDGATLDDQPDLIAVIDDGIVLGYGLRDDVYTELVDPGAVMSGYYVYGPDGTTVRGVFDFETGYVPIEADPPPPRRSDGS